MSIQFAGLLFFLLGILLFAATKAASAYDSKTGYCISAFFMVYALLMEIAGYLDSEFMLILIFPFPIGIGMSMLGFWMIMKGFFYSLKMEGTYITCKYHSKPLFRRRKYYTLAFQYQANDRTIKSCSEDHYILHDIEKRYEPQQVYTIWVNPKNLQDFRVKRFSGISGGLFAIAVFGIGLLSVIIPLLLKMLETG
ncbi:hypothetical protein AALA78_03525 [Lachnospiraceae bacterium 42-17]|jgi:hypothetical protein|nr:hypothetical protein [Dorea sp.]